MAIPAKKAKTDHPVINILDSSDDDSNDECIIIDDDKTKPESEEEDDHISEEEKVDRSGREPDPEPVELVSDTHSDDEDFVMTAKKQPRKRYLISSDEEEDDINDKEKLDRSSGDPGPSTSGPQPHQRHGKLSTDLNIWIAREALIDFLKSVEKDPSLRDDAKRLELEKTAKWNQLQLHNKKSLEIKFTSKALKKKSRIMGYYVTRSNNINQNLAAYYLTSMRSGTSQAVQNRTKEYKKPHHPLYEKVKMSSILCKARLLEQRQPLDQIYSVMMIKPTSYDQSLTPYENIRKLAPIQGIGPIQDVTEYIGINTRPGDFGMRASHFTMKTNRPSPVYQLTVGSNTPCYCFETKIILCDGIHTKEMGEAFLLYYGQLWNEKHGFERYVQTKPECQLSPDLIRKAREYVKENIPMYEIDSGDRSHPPPWATLGQVTTLPFSLHETDLTLRYDPAHPQKKRTYKQIKNFKELVSSFGPPPENYFLTTDHSRDKWKLESERDYGH